MPVDFQASAEQLIASLSIDGYPSIEAAAEAAGMSLRTFQRRLAEVGMTYTGLVSASRLRLAKTWLTESEMPISEIAATLGYSEATNFARVSAPDRYLSSRLSTRNDRSRSIGMGGQLGSEYAKRKRRC